MSLSPPLVYQTRFSDRARGEYGNCYAACISTITGIPLSEFPVRTVESDREFSEVMEKFLLRKTWVSVRPLLDEYSIERLGADYRGIYLIASGNSPRGD